MTQGRLVSIRGMETAPTYNGDRMTEERPPNAKDLGAYYTDAQVADFLVRWAVRDPADTVLDPSFGGGVFLRSAGRHLRALGGDPETQIFGVEVDAAVHSRIADKLADEFSIQRSNLRHGDFFSQPPLEADVIVGNPPFVRYHRFTGEARRRGLERARAMGVELSELCSSWVPFLLYSTANLRQGGRLAMVVPAELAHAAYARPALGVLSSSFRSVTFLMFGKRLFPDLSEDTILLLAEGKGRGPARFYLREVSDAGKLADMQQPGGTPVSEPHRLVTGERRLIEQRLPAAARELYQRLKNNVRVHKLGALADVGIGYVTGRNAFFHLSQQELRQWAIPQRFLRRAVRRGRSFSGTRFTTADWEEGVANGEPGYLLSIRPGDTLTAGVRAYIEYGKREGFDTAYKCRMREPWYAVPHVYKPDAFLTYMSGAGPRVAANHADAVAPNTLHIVRFRPLCGVTADAFATLWQSSLTRLSVEVEGHALGGGMLKLEPTEAGNVLVPIPSDLSDFRAVALRMDAQMRSEGEESVTRYADQEVLQRRLGFTATECGILRDAADELRARRTRRGLPE